jgi:Dyp-type peroxidase family
MAQTNDPLLRLDDIQGDVLQGLQKNSENFVFFKIQDALAFKNAMKAHVIGRITTALLVREREQINQRRKKHNEPPTDKWFGLNVSFTKDGLTQLLGASRPKLNVQKPGFIPPSPPGPPDDHFELGAADTATINLLNDPPTSQWVPKFASDRIDGVFLVTGPNQKFVEDHSQELLNILGNSIKVVYSEIGNVRPDAEKGHEHFGFLDGVSQPGIRGLTPRENPTIAPDQGLPGQDLIWPGEFVFGYPGQDANNATAQGPQPSISVPWATNGSFMVFRRLEQKVPEFHTFVAKQSDSLGMDSELLATRMVGRWRSGAPAELTPLQDDTSLGPDKTRNNNFAFSDDPFQRACPYAAHIRKTNPRDDFPNGNKAAVGVHRIIRAGIPFGPEVDPAEATTTQSRGLMFVCYQTSIRNQFEFLQHNWANTPGFIFGKKRPAGGGGGDVTTGPNNTPGPGFDLIIGQAAGGGDRMMDEPVPNYPTGDKRSTLDAPHQFVVLTAGAYFFVPSITALRTVLT